MPRETATMEDFSGPEVRTDFYKQVEISNERNGQSEAIEAQGKSPINPNALISPPESRIFPVCSSADTLLEALGGNLTESSEQVNELGSSALPYSEVAPSNSAELSDTNQQPLYSSTLPDTHAGSNELAMLCAPDSRSAWDSSQFDIMDWMVFDSLFEDCDDIQMVDPVSLPPQPDSSVDNVPSLGSWKTTSCHGISSRDCQDFGADSHWWAQLQNSCSREKSSNHDPPPSAHKLPTDWLPGKYDNVSSFPDMQSVPIDVLEAEDFANVGYLTRQAYRDLLLWVERTSHGQGHYRPFQNSVLPPLQVMNCFIQLYFEYFHPVFPMLHQATFNPSEAPQVLVLATVAIGCRYSKVAESGKGANALQELLRRAIAYTCEQDNTHVRQLWLTQAIILNSIGMLYSGDGRLLELAEANRNSPITQCRRNSSLSCLDHSPSIDTDSQGLFLEEKWQEWARQEACRRLGFCAFLMDAQVVMYLGLHPCMAVGELQQHLPCCEDIWQANSAQMWKELYLREQHPSTLPCGSRLTAGTALTWLRLGKPLPQRFGDFARLILVFAISSSSTSIHQQLCNHTVPNGDDRLLTAQWDKDAHRALGSLRYPGSIDGDNALQFSVTCHSHLAAMLLKLPRRELLSYAHTINTDKERVDTRQKLHEWITRNNGFDARPAVSHAGIVWGMCRSQNQPQGFYMPLMTFLTILVLWAYSHLAEDTQGYVDSGIPYKRQTNVRLDRYRSDEETREWVESGHSFRGYLTDVGNLFRPGASIHFLQVSSQILDAMDTWDFGQCLATWLRKLRRRTSGQSSPESHSVSRAPQL